ncbi:MAG: hypothetical protein HYV63_16070 [Candidatus Schekmanbacteria bacterium]|nr:hypothetical protein [Candidatus Schekmanbacteria bacterium]
MRFPPSSRSDRRRIAFDDYMSRAVGAGSRPPSSAVALSPPLASLLASTSAPATADRC